MSSTTKNRKKRNGSSSRKVKGGNADRNVAEKSQGTVVPIDAGSTGVPAESPTATIPSKKRRGKAPTEGEPLRRVLIFLSDSDITALKAEVGNRGVSTKIREIVKAYLKK